MLKNSYVLVTHALT